ncbi:MAG: 3-dehydroquinate synthase [Planctomycetes bacterium]|nr:3-dehydroquinate synthase [Planctomycetota bacterium]
MRSKTIMTSCGPYVVRIGEGALTCLGDVAAGASSIVVVTDDIVAPLHGSKVIDALANVNLTIHEWTVPAGEASKSLWQAESFYDFLASKSCDRSTVIVALGGGVVGDLAGFVAGTWMRGVRFVNCPTTLLAMVDASIGGKTGLNHAGRKNAVGVFYQPEAVLVDITTLTTLDDRAFNAGMAESIKHGVIADEAFLSWQMDNAHAIERREARVLEKLVARNIEIKAAHVEQDERDQSGVRAKLNFGHTIGHAIEVVSGYALPHGECVGLGMLGAVRIAIGRGLVDEDVRDRLVAALDSFSLPCQFTSQGDIGTVMSALRGDKKSVGGVARFVLPTKIGEVTVGHDVGDAEIESAIAELIE